MHDHMYAQNRERAEGSPQVLNMLEGASNVGLPQAGRQVLNVLNGASNIRLP